jgi:pimeloyl-ACP methyl ester carboxylesterase
MAEYISVFRNESGQKAVMDLYDSIINSVGIAYEDYYLSTRLGETHIIVSGKVEKPPLILIHAYYASAASWYRNLKILSENFRVYNVDIIGDPNKSRPTKVIRQLKDFVEWLDDLMEGLKLDSAYFVGNSVGAFHITNYAIQYPNKVKRMILIGPAATFIQILPFYFHTFPGGITGWPLLVNHAIKWVENDVEFEPNFRRLFYLLLRFGKATNQVFPKVFTNEELKSIKVPTLLVYGAREAIYKYELAIVRAKKLIDNLTIKIIDRGNHITSITNYEQINKAILDFLK